MTLSLGCASVDLIVILLLVIVAIILYVRRSYTYWKKKGVPVAIQPKFFFGSFGNSAILDAPIAEKLKAQYDVLKSEGHKHGGCYILTSPVYIAIDPDLIKNIISKDFNHFVSRGLYYNEKDDPLSAHLVSIEKQQWRNLRHKLTPTFSSGKMKMMFNIFVECGRELEKAMNLYTNDKKAVPIKDFLQNYTMDVIGSCAFGIHCNSFTNPDSQFLKMGRRIFNQTPKDNFFRSIGFSFPKLARKLGIALTPKETSDFYLDVVKQTVKYREQNNVIRNDFMQILIELKNNTSASASEVNGVSTNLTIEQIAAQAFVFFLAGFETSSTTMTYCLFELAENAGLQQKVREEVSTVLARHKGQLSYDAIQEMKYMDQVIEEALRKYPPVPILNRKCTERYNVPETDLIIEEGVAVLIPSLAIHHDPEHYPEPDKFDPERFSEENKKTRNPYTYLPFGEGPRICIGLRFGVMQSKVGLALLLKNFQFSLNKKTQVPLKTDPHSFILSAVGGIWLDVKRV